MNLHRSHDYCWCPECQIKAGLEKGDELFEAAKETAVIIHFPVERTRSEANYE